MRHLLALILGSVLALTGACTAPPEPAGPDGGPPITDEGISRADAAESPENDGVERPPGIDTPPLPSALNELQFRERMQEVKDLIASENYDAALERLDALRDAMGASGPPTGSDFEFEALHIELKRHLLQSVYVDAVVVLDRERVPLPDAITGRILLVNLSDETLVIPGQRFVEAEIPPHPDATGPVDPADPARRRLPPQAQVVQSHSISTLYIEMDYSEYGADGLFYDDRLTWSQEVGEDLVLAPGERKSWALNLDTRAFRPERPSYRRYEIRATFFPSQIRIGDEVFAGNLTFDSRTCHVFPGNYEHLASAPLSRLREAVDKESPPHIPVTAALVADADRAAAIHLLMRALSLDGLESHEGKTRVACCVALAILTDERLSARPQAWIDRVKESPEWWTGNR